jgi:hypothetical protein
MMQTKKRRSLKTMEAAVEDRVLPEGTNEEQWACLQSAVTRCMEKINTVPIPITKERYNYMLGLTLAALYSFAPQGRIGGLATMQMNQVPRLVEEGFGFTANFKTSSKYGLQPIVGSVPGTTCLQVAQLTANTNHKSDLRFV